MDPIFTNAFCLPPTPELLGRRLLPFSLGHSLLLESIESPVLRGGTVMPGELAVAIWICMRTAVDPVLQQPPAVDRDAVAAEFAAWGRATPRAELAEALDAFRAYLAAYTTAPERWDGDRVGSAPKSPWQYAVVNALREHLHMDYAAAWNTPVNRALAEYATLGEAHGDTSLISDEERAELEQLEREGAAPQAGSTGSPQARGAQAQQQHPEARRARQAHQRGHEARKDKQHAHGGRINRSTHDRK